MIGDFLCKICTDCEAGSADIKTRLNCKTCVLLNIKEEPQAEFTLTCDNCLWKDDEASVQSAR